MCSLLFEPREYLCKGNLRVHALNWNEVMLDVSGSNVAQQPKNYEEKFMSN